MGWLYYALAWIAAAVFWSLAAAAFGSTSPLVMLPFGFGAMGTAAAAGVAVWWLTGRLDWHARRVPFLAMHLAALLSFTVVYTFAWAMPDLVRLRFAAAWTGVITSPSLVWNLLMGSWLYLIVAGLSYAIRGHRRLRAEETAAAEARLLAEQAQLSALRAQVNPHFLFNALHTIGALVQSDPARADRAIERLGDLLRYTLDSADEVSFAQEWAFVQDYLAFEQLRLADRLQVDAHVDEQALGAAVPPLVLQPIVENAIRHGIADRPGGGRVELSAAVQNGSLLLRVSDDGGGVPAGSNDGIGLSALRRRLQALYGTHAQLRFERAAAGCTVLVQLPFERKGAVETPA